MGVIWGLFSKKKVGKKLGIVQLQWAFNFLKGVHNSNGEHPTDVQLCIDVIQDALIAQYANMVDSVLPAVTPTRSEEDTRSAKSFPSSSSSAKSAGEIGRCRPKCNCDEFVTCAFSKEEPLWPPHLQGVADEANFSHNYGDISMSSALVSQMKGKKQTEAKEKDGEEKSTNITTLAAHDTQSKEFMNKYSDWRKNQLDNIQDGLARLKSLEKFIKTDR